MRVLHIDRGRELRGGQRQVLLLLRKLSESGHEVILLARPRHPLWEAAQAAGLPLLAADFETVWVHSGRADLVHVHDAISHTLAAVASRAPFVVSRRVAFEVQRGPLSAWKYRRPRRFLAVSQFVASQLRCAGISPAKIDVVYDGVNPPMPSLSSKAGFKIVALASTDPEKGRNLVQLAAARAKLTVCFSDDLERDLVDASAFIYISQSEGLGSAALLAMSLQVPVIASRTGGLPEAVEDGVSGLVVNNDVESIASAMLRIASDISLTQKLGVNGRIRVEQKFTAGKLLEGTLESYRKALANS